MKTDKTEPVTSGNSRADLLTFRRRVAFSDHWAAKCLRTVYRAPSRISLPAPTFVIRPLRIGYVFAREIVYFLRRVSWAEPMFKSYCTRYGKGLRVGIYAPWVQGKGEIVLGDNVSISGQCSFKFAARYVIAPRFIVGDRTGIGHLCSFTIGKEISIGNDCRIASNVMMMDAPGHSREPEARKRGEPAPDEDVKPIHIGDNVWIGTGAAIFPGVTIGDNSVIAANAVIIADVAPNSVMLGNPARRTGVATYAQPA